MSTTYVVHNGSRPFRVVCDTHFSIFAEFDSPEEEIYSYSTVPLYSFSLDGRTVLPTEDPGLEGHSFVPNNTILVDQGDGTYLFVGGPQIYTFRPDGPIRHFYSPIGNSEVPYPWAVSDNSTYLLVEKAVIPNRDIPTNDPYLFYYCFDRQGETRFEEFSKMKSFYRNLVPTSIFFPQTCRPITAYTPEGKKVVFQMKRDHVGDFVIPDSYIRSLDSGELLESPPENFQQ